MQVHQILGKIILLVRRGPDAASFYQQHRKLSSLVMANRQKQRTKLYVYLNLSSFSMWVDYLNINTNIFL